MKATKKGLNSYARRILDKYYPDMPTPNITIDNKSKRFAAQADSYHSISMTKWIMKDRQEAYSTLRHELAHNIVAWLRLPYSISHGKEFKQILKQIAPKTWHNDLHWNMSQSISQARINMGIKPRIYKPLPWRYFTCGNPDCPAIPKHKYGFKRIPSYIQRGLFAKCPDCGCPEIIEINGTTRFKSVH